MRALLVVLTLLLGVAPRAAADAGDKALAREALIALRVLAYDRALATRAPGEAVTVLVVAPSTKLGRAQLEVWRRAFALMPNVKAGGRRVQARVHELVDESGLDAAVVQLRPALVIVAAASDITPIRRVTRKRQALSYVANESLVRAGLAFGVLRSEDGSEIVINLDAARAEGARFSAGLLQLARIVDEVRP